MRRNGTLKVQQGVPDIFIVKGGFVISATTGTGQQGRRLVALLIVGMFVIVHVATERFSRHDLLQGHAIGVVVVRQDQVSMELTNKTGLLGVTVGILHRG